MDTTQTIDPKDLIAKIRQDKANPELSTDGLFDTLALELKKLADEAREVDAAVDTEIKIAVDDIEELAKTL